MWSKILLLSSITVVGVTVSAPGLIQSPVTQQQSGRIFNRIVYLEDTEYQKEALVVDCYLGLAETADAFQYVSDERSLGTNEGERFYYYLASVGWEYRQQLFNYIGVTGCRFLKQGLGDLLHVKEKINFAVVSHFGLKISIFYFNKLDPWHQHLVFRFLYQKG